MSRVQSTRLASESEARAERGGMMMLDEAALVELVKTLGHEALLRIESDLACTEKPAGRRAWLLAQKDTITLLLERLKS